MLIEDRAHTQGQRNTILKKEKDLFRNFILRENVYVGKLFAFGIKKKKMLAIAKSLDVDGLIPRVHGRIGNPPTHSLTYTDR